MYNNSYMAEDEKLFVPGQEDICDSCYLKHGGRCTITDSSGLYKKLAVQECPLLKRPITPSKSQS